MSDTEIVVVLEDAPPDIVVILEDILPEIQVTVSEVGLKGDPGKDGEGGEEFLDQFEQELDAHVNSPTPHPIYDDGPSLFLLYQNAKV